MHEHGQRLSVTEKKIKLIINKDMKIITTTLKVRVLAIHIKWKFIL